MESSMRLPYGSSRRRAEHAYGSESIMGGSWALPAGVGGTALARGATAPERALDLSEGLYPDDTQRGLDPASLTGTKGAYDPYTGAFGTAGTPVTCGYGMSGSTIGIGHTAGRRRWEEGGYRGATPDAYAYEHGGNRAPATAPRRGASTYEPVPAHAPSRAPKRGASLLERLLGTGEAAAGATG
jgi:hypothetical protein